MGKGPETGVWNCEGVITLLRRLLVLAATKLLDSGCHVLRRHASSAALVIESRREKIDDVGEATTLIDGESGPAEALMRVGPKSGRPGVVPWGDWKGLPAEEGTLNRRPGVRDPAYML
jgi:hypothetical protein